jgi:hypothetical protein
VIWVALGPEFGFVAFGPVFLGVPEGDFEYFFVVGVVFDDIFFEELVFSSEFVIDGLSDFFDFSATVISVPAVVSVFDTVAVVGFFDNRKY